MPKRIEQKTFELINAPTPEILVIGNGKIGEKAQQLIDKTSVLCALGFNMPRRVVLAEGFFVEFWQRNGLGANLEDVNPNIDNIEYLIRRGNFSANQIKDLEVVCNSYGTTPLVIRSSAEGDARGTGTYKSEFVENDIDHFCEGLKKVLASYFSPDAIAFRQDAHTGEGFGVIVEPIIGQNFGGVIAPVLSGFGYTSTSRGGSYLTIVPGLGCAVESRDGERITKNQIKKYDGSLGDYIDAEMRAMFDGQRAFKRSALLGANRYFSDPYSALAFAFSDHWGRHEEVVNTFIKYPDKIKKVIDNLNLELVFSAMERIEQYFNKPQYIEWAMTVEDDDPIFWIIQIADVDKKLDLMDFGTFGEIMFVGHTVIGTGIREAIKIVNCLNPNDIASLNHFNQENKDYVLIFLARLTSAGGVERTLRYRDFSNASVLLEIQDTRHLGDPIAHLGDQLDMAGKLFAVLDYNSEPPPNWDLFHKGEQQEYGLLVYNGKIKVVSSEKQNKLAIYAQI